MPTPACYDALSREVYEPVHDPLSGRCYRNPCAAEEDDVLNWVPGCLPVAPPIYGNYDGGGASDGGGGSYDGPSPGWRPWHPSGGRQRRPLGPPHLRPGGGLRTGGSNRTVGGGPRPGRTMLGPSGGGLRLLDSGPGGTLALAPAPGVRLIDSGPGGTLAIARRYYTQPQASTSAPMRTVYAVQRSQSSAPMRMAPMSVSTMGMSRAAMKGLGQVPTIDPTRLATQITAAVRDDTVAQARAAQIRSYATLVAVGVATGVGVRMVGARRSVAIAAGVLTPVVIFTGALVSSLGH